MMIDIDEIDHLSSRMKFFSHNRFNLVSFYDSDHGGTSEATLRSQIERLLERSGLDANGQKITLFCMPRILGYGFNPLSVFFCYRQDGEPSAIVYEVHNTFGERHSYVMACESNDKTPITRCCDKEFYVSPFLDMDMFYSFRVRTPGCHINIAISGQDKDGPLITASLSGLRTGLSDRTLLKAVLTHPLLTLKVMAAIHWHALRMVLKGFRLHPRSPGKSHSVTIIPNNGSSR